MSSGVEQTVLERASRHGIEPGYWDITGTWHETSHELRLAVLASLSVDGNDSPVRGADLWVDSVLVVPVEKPSILLRLPESWNGTVYLTIHLEQGTQRILTFVPTDKPGPRTLHLPTSLPIGYHRGAIRAHQEAQVTVIVCPSRTWLPAELENGRRAGLAVSLYGVHTANTWGCGDFTALRPLIDWVVDEIGGTYIALNPLHAIYNREPYNTSPYLPNSLYYRNFIYLDIDAIPGMGACAAAQTLRQSHDVTTRIQQLNDAEFVDYEGVAQLKLRFLRLLFDYFRRAHLDRGSSEGLEFQHYCRQEEDLLFHYALYMALDAYLHSQDPNLWCWQDWPAKYQDPGSASVAEFAREHQNEILFHQWVQWQIGQQAKAAQQYALMRGMEIGLFHDLPLATDKCGAELWAHRRFYVQGCRVGAPPDAFSPNGQDWSFPPPNREAHRANSYRWFAESLRHSARHGGALRIDHVMRLFRLYWIPDDYDAMQGTYVRDFDDDLLHILALESHRGRFLVVGEDLGTVESWMREKLEGFGILSYRLFYFERIADGSFKSAAEYPDQALVSSTTHDLPTLAGFWACRDIETRTRLGFIESEDAASKWRASRREEKLQMIRRLKRDNFLEPSFPEQAADGPELSGEIHNAITGFLASTPCLLMSLNQEDLTKELDQQNLPGTTWQYPNWQRKMRFPADQLASNSLTKDFATMLRTWLIRTRRCAPSALRNS